MKSGDKPSEDLVVNILIIHLTVLCMVMGCQIMINEDNYFVMTIHRYRNVFQNCELHFLIC